MLKSKITLENLRKGNSQNCPPESIFILKLNLKISIFHVRHMAQDQWIQPLPWQDEGLDFKLSIPNKASVKSVLLRTDSFGL